MVGAINNATPQTTAKTHHSSESNASLLDENL